MLTLEPFSEDQGRSAVHPARGIPPISFLAPCGFTHPLTRTHVRLLGPCFKTGRMGCPQAGAGSTQLGLWPPHQSAPVHAPSRSADRLSPFHIRPGRIAGPHSLPSRQFQALFDSLFKVLFIFPSRYLFAIGLTPVFSLGRNLPRPIGAAFPNNPTRRQRLVVRQGPGTTGLSPSLAPPSRGLGPGPPLRTLLQTTIRTARPSDFQAGLIPSPPDLGSRSKHRLKTTHWGLHQGPSLTAHDARHNTRVFSTTTSRASTEGDSSLGQPHHKHGRPISAPMPCVPIRDAWLGATRCVTPRQACPRPDGFGRNLRFDNDPSAGSPTETLLRLLLPLNDKVQWNSRDVAGGEPPTSPRS
ncbi:hypothetical protein L1887_55000 [Cichorium endivia]|nr:hypothetical protein L1887_55000 [Cichorium endivia]